MRASLRQHLPWRFAGTDMAPNLLLMCKLLMVVGWQHRHYGRFSVPHIPWLGALDILHPWADATSSVLWFAYAGASFLLLFNIAVRPACFTLGSILVLALLASRPLFRNHILFPGVLLILAAVHRKDETPRFLHLQFVLLYLGAFLDKICEADWRNGEVMRIFLTELNPMPFHGVLEQALSEGLVARLVSWGTIGTEALLVVFFALPRFHAAGVWTAILFHGSIFIILVGGRFGYFLDGILLGLLSFMTWPKAGLEISVHPRFHRGVQALLRLVHWGTEPAQLNTSLPPDANWLHVRADQRHFRDEAGLRHILHYSAGFYILLLVADTLIGRWLPWKITFALQTLTGVGLAAFFLPLPWRRLPSSRARTK